MRKISILSLHEVAPMRQPGYLEAVRARGRTEEDVIILADEDYAELSRQYRLPGITNQNQAPLSKQRFAICKACVKSMDAGFGCAHHTGCCFGRWRSQSASKCPEGKW
jgi:hypothetical protein